MNLHWKVFEVEYFPDFELEKYNHFKDLKYKLKMLSLNKTQNNTFKMQNLR